MNEAFRGDNGDMGTARPSDVLSLSEFNRRTRDLIDRLRKDGRPVVVTTRLLVLQARNHQ